MLLKIFFLLLFFLILIVFLYAFYRTYRAQHDPRQQQFLKGIVPNTLPDGLLHGSVNAKTNWLGKRFDAKAKTGINLFQDGGAQNERFPFKLGVGKGIADPQIDVIKIDYDIAGNPLWLRHVLDEIVEIAPNHYLGKLHFRVFPFLTFTLGYFELKK